MAHMSATLVCLAWLTISLSTVDKSAASPLMSVHAGDAAGRRQRLSTSSWAAPTSGGSISGLTSGGLSTMDDSATLELFNPMVRSRTYKTVDRVRPFNFRPVDADDAAPTHLSDTNAYFPLFRGGNNEPLAGSEDTPADIEGLKNFVDGLKSRLRDEISMLLTITKNEDDLIQQQQQQQQQQPQPSEDVTKIQDNYVKPRKLVGLRAFRSFLHHPSATFGKRRFVPSQLI